MLNTPGEVRDFYRKTYAEHGPSPRGMAWGDTKTHYKRVMRIHHLLVSLDVPMNRILDVGCGVGLVHNLWGLAYKERTYHGVDLVPEFIEEARAGISKDPKAIVVCEDFMDWVNIDPFSVALGIGTFAWQTSDAVRSMLYKMWGMVGASGALAVTLIPDNPLPMNEVRRLKGTLDAKEMLLYNGYSDRLDEHIVILVKKDAETLAAEAMRLEEMKDATYDVIREQYEHAHS